MSRERPLQLSFALAAALLTAACAAPKELVEARGREAALAKAGAPATERAEAADRVAELYAARGSKRAARKAYRRALAEKSEDVRALRALGDPGSGLLAPRVALPYADRLVEASSRGSQEQLADALRRRASLRDALGDAAGADADRRRAAAAAPEDLQALWALISGDALPADALALADARRPAAEKALPAWRVLRGQILARQGDGAGARREFDAAVAQDGAGVCFGDTADRQRGRLDAAYFDACAARFPDRAVLYLDRGVARYRSGRREEAAADFRRALELEPSNTEAALSLATALSDAGRRDEALGVVDRAESQAKDRSSPAYAGLLELRRGLKRTAPK